MLKNHTDLAPGEPKLQSLRLGDVGIIENDAASCGAFEQVDETEQGRLASSRGTDEASGTTNSRLRGGASEPT